MRMRASSGALSSVMPDSRSGKFLEDAQAHGIFDQALGLSAYLELETLLEADGADDARRVLHKGQGVQDADDPVLDVLLASEKIHHTSEVGRAEVDGQGIDGKIAPVEVHLQG